MTLPAIQYVPPQRNEEGRVIGIDVAVRTLLDAYFRYGRAETFYCRTRNRDSYAEFCDQMRAAGADPARCRYLAEDDADGLRDVSLLFRPDPNINGHVTSAR